MPSMSSLAALYEAVYHVPPSSQSTAALLAMEQILGIAADDPLARMLIVLLHSNDRIDKAAGRIEDALQQRSKDEGAIVEKVTPLVRELERLKRDLHDLRFDARPQRESTGCYITADGVTVDAYRKASPMLAHLRKAFERRTSVEDQRNAVSAARFDLFLISMIGAILMLIGFAVRTLTSG